MTEPTNKDRTGIVGPLTGDWDYGSLPANVRISPGCYLERRASFDAFRSERDPGLVIGAGVEVYTWTTFNLEPTGYVEIGANSVIVGAVFMVAESIVLGERVVVSYMVTLADCDFHPRDPVQRKRDAEANAPFGDRSKRPPLESRPVLIGDDVRIGTGAIILKGVTIGRGAVIGPGAVVTHDVAPDTHLVGNPARPFDEADRT